MSYSNDDDYVFNKSFVQSYSINCSEIDLNEYIGVINDGKDKISTRYR